MMPDPERLKVQALVEAARQRLLLAAHEFRPPYRTTSQRILEHTQDADELLAEAQKVLRLAGSTA